MTAPTLRSTTEVWTFDPPVPCERVWATRMTGPILVHQLHRTVTATGAVNLDVKGVPTTSTGKPNGGVDWRTVTDAEVDWRTVTDAELQRLHLLVLDAKPEDGARL